MWFRTIAFALVSLSVGSAAQESDLALAERLAEPNARQAAVAEIVARGNDGEALLLSWAQDPPLKQRSVQLYAGMADAFAVFKTKAAIPFLVKNISVPRGNLPVDWSRAAEPIENRLPAVAALIRIGADSVPALIQAGYQPATPWQYIAIVFAVSRIGGKEAQGFLQEALALANAERYWAGEALDRIAGQQSPVKGHK
jgi:hypothetical protein